MLVRRSEPMLLTEEGLEGLCASLNRPVVDVEAMPVGPARAAIALYREADGRRGLLLAVRSEESGGLAIFEFPGELTASAHQAMDAGLSFAEGMGFLFDEDMCLSGASNWRRVALMSWCELTGDELPEPVSPEPVSPEPLPQVGDGSAGAVLSKFRRPKPVASAQLGRIPIVRRRGSEEVAEVPPLLTRLLARF